MLRVTTIRRFLLVGWRPPSSEPHAADPARPAPPSPVDVGSGSLTGAGATFPAPFYQKAFFDYSAKYPQVTINYQPVGSGAGIQQFIKNTVDFGASDVPMAAADITSAGGPDTLTQIPTTLGVISIAFNFSGVAKLQPDADTLAGIFLGHITKWNDPALTALNSGVTLPEQADHRRAPVRRQRHHLPLHRLPEQGLERSGRPRSATRSLSAGR